MYTTNKKIKRLRVTGLINVNTNKRKKRTHKKKNLKIN